MGVDWSKRACQGVGVDPDWWHVGVGTREVNRKAVMLCRACPILADCAEVAAGEPLDTMLGAIWAGRRWDGGPVSGHYSKLPPGPAVIPASARECERCERPFMTDSPRKVFCSEACRRRVVSAGKYRGADCRRCGKDFLVTSPRKVFCSEACQRLSASKATAGLMCKFCGAQFSAARSNQLYCSGDCHHAARRQRRKVKPREVILRVCAAQSCTVDFPAVNRQGGERVYCSNECGNRERSRLTYERAMAERARLTPEAMCLHCLKFFKRGPGARTYCSVSCALLSREARPRLWRGGYVRPDPVELLDRECTVCGAGFAPRNRTQHTCGKAECTAARRKAKERRRREKKYIERAAERERTGSAHQHAPEVVDVSAL